MSDSKNRPEDNAQSEGQVSEVGAMDPAEADTPIIPDQATAGYPEAESGHAQEGTAGPNAKPNPENEPN
ncbi:hypothetical protein ACOACO_04905 [Nocardioides sp. CPCC 205120]|uniref:hypothetical protein n=1 Tax=Nocardioides sp. CPCC 205120 TaxID=3406462 RepID=UPI003B509453